MILLLGTIANGPNSVALFALGEMTVARRRGEKVSYFTVGSIERTGVLLRHENRTYIVRPGDHLDGGNVTPIQITTGIETVGSKMRITSQLREYVTKDGLLPILNQAASEPVYEGKEQVGYRVFEIDKGSAFDLAGLQDGDVVKEIDGTILDNPFTSLKALTRIKTADKFSFRYERAGVNKTMHVEVW